MDEADLRAIAGADDLSHMCAVVLAALADREKGREVLNFNTVDVVLDRDEGTVLVQDVLDSDAASLRASVVRFKELAAGLTDPQKVSDAIARRRRAQEERRVWDMPPGTA